MKKPPAKWHAVTVVLRESSCAAAALCRNTKFLSREAPRLPLPTCPHPEKCPCTFRHYEDRRAGPRRSADIGGGLSSEKRDINRRASVGRRATDKR
jgi:hypothetical protein